MPHAFLDNNFKINNSLCERLDAKEVTTTQGYT